jgi:hypothetical protein
MEELMQIMRALKFYFDDPHWFRKVLVAAACLLIPLLGWAIATGWALEICRRVIRGQKDEAPGIDLRRQLPDGLAGWGIVLAYLLPAGLFLGAAGILSALIFPAGKSIAPAAFDSYWWGIELLAAALLLGGALGTVAALGRFADAGSFRSAFQLREIVSSIRSAPVAYLQVVLMGIPLGLLALLGIAVFGAGLLFTTAYAIGSGFHLAGQAHLLAAARRVASGPVPGPV